MLMELQTNLDYLAKSCGAKPVDLRPVVKSTAQQNQRAAVIKLDPITKRDTAGSDPLGSEGLGTRSARATGNVAKAESEVDMYGGFASMSRITGKH